MTSNVRIWKRWRLALAAALATTGLTLAADMPEPLAAPAQPKIVAVEAAPALDLTAARHLALDKQPALGAYRASAAAADEKLHALEKMRLAGLIRRDLPTRRKQAEQGTVAVHAQLRKAENDTVYATTRTYLSVLYARQQLAIAERALADDSQVTSLNYLKKVAENIYKERTRKDVKKWHVDQIDVLIQSTRARREEAKQGVDRALAALREAIGLEPEDALIIDPKATLPSLNPTLDKAQVIALALERRGEILQANVGLEVTSLEIEAQKRIMGLRGDTFASGSDIHAEPIPTGFANGEYRPGAITIEMPGTLAGKRGSRIEQAEALQGRASSVVDKTRHLIALEAEDAYLKWIEYSRQAAEYDKAAKAADRVVDEIANTFNPNDKDSGQPTLTDYVEARLRATQLQLLVNQTRFQALLALAALERVTAGGIQPGFEK